MRQATAKERQEQKATTSTLLTTNSGLRMMGGKCAATHEAAEVHSLGRLPDEQFRREEEAEMGAASAVRCATHLDAATAHPDCLPKPARLSRHG